MAGRHRAGKKAASGVRKGSKGVPLGRERATFVSAEPVLAPASAGSPPVADALTSPTTVSQAPSAGSPSATTDATRLTGATFYRLKSKSPDGPIENADEYIADLNRSPLIQEINEGESAMRLYGYANEGRVPPFAEFLARFDKLVVPRVPRFAYVLVVRVPSDPRSWYAIGFGAGGRYLLKDDLIDVDAHRDVAQSETIPTGPGETARLKQIRTRRIGPNTTLIQRRSSRTSTLGEFNVDRYTEIVDEVDGAPRSSEKFGTALSGGQGLTVRKTITFEAIPGIAADLEAVYRQTNADSGAVAKTMFPVKDKALVARLDEQLAAMVVSPSVDAEISFAIPDFIRAEDDPEVHFTRLGHGSQRFSDDVRLSDYHAALTEAGLIDKVDVGYLRKAELVIGDESGKGRRFSVYRCLTALVEMDGAKYVHNDRSWYNIPADVLQYIDEQLASIRLLDEVLPTPASRVAEPAYNRQAGSGNYLLLDARLVAPVPGQSAIEIADLFAVLPDGGREVATFVHVKRDFSSSKLSHLFEQGRVSAFLLQQGAERALILERIETELRRRSPKPTWSRRVRAVLGDANFQARNTRVVFAILGDWGGRTPVQRLPFFSKLVLVEAAQMLRGREFDVCIARVQMPGPTYKGRNKKPAAPKSAVAAVGATSKKARTAKKVMQGNAPARRRASKKAKRGNAQALKTGAAPLKRAGGPKRKR